MRPDAEIAAHLGEVLWVSGMAEEAQKIWAESVKGNPGNQLLNDTIKKFKGSQADKSPPAAPASPAAE